jgi:ribulose-phosphate 3-epimerase
MMVTVAASLWSTPRDRIDAEARRLAAAGLRRWHWDVSDGVFADPGGFDIDTVGRIGHATGLPGEAHLMVSDPLTSVDAWAEVCDTVIVHVEAEGWERAVDRVRHRGVRPGVAISPDTPVSTLTDLPDDVAVLVMSIVPGRAGATFMPATLERLSSLAGRAHLGVDGGVTLALARDCGAHGATWVVSGSSLCGCDDPGAWLRAASGHAARSA